MTTPSARTRASKPAVGLAEAEELARRSRETGCDSLSDCDLEALLHSAADRLAETRNDEHIADALGAIDTAVRRRLGIWRAAISEPHELEGAIRQIRQQAEQALREPKSGPSHGNTESTEAQAVAALADLLARLTTEHPSEVRLRADFYRLLDVADDSGCLWFAPTDQQLTAAALLLHGVIVEMDAGEGKTLASAMAAAVLAASGRGVHILTANDYLATRDCDLLAPVLESLGLTVGLVVEGMDRRERQFQYAAQVVFTTAREVGFDYLRDSIAVSFDHRVNPRFDVAIVDEADHLLIDQARTPLIISGDRSTESVLGADVESLAAELVERQAGHVDNLYAGMTSSGSDYSETLATILLAGGLTPRLVSELDRRDIPTRSIYSDLSRLNDDDEGRPLENDLLFVIDPARTTLRLTELGWDAVLDEVEAPSAAFGAMQALRALVIHEAGADYVMGQNGITLVDRLDGRPMAAHRYMHGLHEALESKEGLDRLGRTDAKARTSIRALMSNYETISGLTGTALEAADTFAQDFGASTVRVPPEVPSKRVDLDSEVFFDKDEHLAWTVDQVEYWHRFGRPVLVTTGSVRESDVISSALSEQSIPHRLLNAENAEGESAAVECGGEVRAVTVSTGMAGRGTDFVVADEVDSVILETAISRAREVLERDKTPVFVCSSHEEAAALVHVFGKPAGWEVQTRETGSASEVVVRPRDSEELSEERLAFGLGLVVLITSLPESVRVERQIRGRTARQGAFGTSKVAVYINDPALAFSSRQGDLIELARSRSRRVEGPEVSRMLGQVQLDTERQRELVSHALAEYEAVVEGESRAHYEERGRMMDSVQPPTLAGSIVTDWITRRTIELDDHRSDYGTRFGIVSDGLWHKYRIDIEGLANSTPTQARRELELEVHRRLSVHRDRLGSKRFSLAVAECRLNAADELWPPAWRT